MVTDPVIRHVGVVVDGHRYSVKFMCYADGEVQYQSCSPVSIGDLHDRVVSTAKQLLKEKVYGC